MSGKGPFWSGDQARALSSLREVLISDNGWKPAETEDAPVPLGQRLWFIALMMFVFFPVGLVLFWRHDLFPPSAKWLVTVVVLTTVVWALFTVGPR